MINWSKLKGKNIQEKYANFFAICYKIAEITYNKKPKACFEGEKQENKKCSGKLDFQITFSDNSIFFWEIKYFFNPGKTLDSSVIPSFIASIALLTIGNNNFKKLFLCMPCYLTQMQKDRLLRSKKNDEAPEIIFWDAEFFDKISEDIRFDKIFTTYFFEGYKDTLSSSPSGISDQPARNDFLGRNSYARILSRFIANKNTITPLNIAICSPWGEGKSSFINFIKNELLLINKQIDESKYKFKLISIGIRLYKALINPIFKLLIKFKLVNKLLNLILGRTNLKESLSNLHINLKQVNNIYTYSRFVYFKAWMYDDQEQIWAGLLQEIYDEYKKNNKFAIVKDIINNFFILLIKEPTSWFILTIFIACYFVQSSLLSISFNFKIESYSLLDLFKTLVMILTLLTGIYKLFDFLKKSFENVSKGFKKYFSGQLYKDHLGFRVEIIEKLDQILKRWIKKDQKLILFIDDLDRCSHDKIIQVLEALKLFFDRPNILVVMGIDFQVVSNAVINKYSNLINNANYCSYDKFSYDYLEKILQVTFFLSRPDEYDNFIDNLLQQNNINKDEDNSINFELKDIDLKNNESKLSNIKKHISDNNSEMYRFINNLKDFEQVFIEPNVLIELDEIYIQNFKFFTNLIKPNPRVIKKLINILKILRIILNEKSIPYDPKILICWIYLCEKWPNSANNIYKFLNINKSSSDKNILEILQHQQDPNYELIFKYLKNSNLEDGIKISYILPFIEIVKNFSISINMCNLCKNKSCFTKNNPSISEVTDN